MTQPPGTPKTQREPLKLSDSDIARFLGKIKKTESGCWVWTDSLDSAGYGRMKIEGRLVPAHIISWSIAHPHYIPQRYVKSLDHQCENHACVFVGCLVDTTHVANVMRGTGWGAANARKTHCLRGHEFTPKNTRMDNGGKSRRCRTCAALRVKGEHHV
jgi:hypothetical protein